MFAVFFMWIVDTFLLTNIQNQMSFQTKKMNAKTNSMDKSNQRLIRRSDWFAIDKYVLEFCLMEVQKTQYKFSTLEIILYH